MQNLEIGIRFRFKPLQILATGKRFVFGQVKALSHGLLIPERSDDGIDHVLDITQRKLRRAIPDGDNSVVSDAKPNGGRENVAARTVNRARPKNHNG